MDNNKVYEVIRELICLVFYASNNLEWYGSLCECFVDGKKYELYFSGGIKKYIYIKCDNDSLLLMVEDNEYRRYINGPLENDVILHVNSYKNIDFNAFLILNMESIKKENVNYQSKIILSCYLYSNCLYYNPNSCCQCGNEEKKYIFSESEDFDKFLEKNKFLPKMDSIFSPEILLALIECVYSNFRFICMNNKIDGFIDSLSQEELVILKEKLLKLDTSSEYCLKQDNEEIKTLKK